jgi:hypothetical protein
MARGTGVAVEISALLKGAQWGKKDGGSLASTRRRGRGAWYDALMSWRPGGWRSTTRVSGAGGLWSGSTREGAR